MRNEKKKYSVYVKWFKYLWSIKSKVVKLMVISHKHFNFNLNFR